jgi:flagellar assembly factor FliW
MPQCETKYFGTVEYDPREALDFPAGLPGFEARRRFLAIEEAAHRPVVFLQSLEDPQLCFLTLPVLAVDPAYRLQVSSDDLAALEFNSPRLPVIGTDVVCLVIVAIDEHGHMTANLLAPVIINPATGRAVQSVRDDAVYACSHRLREAPCL